MKLFQSDGMEWERSGKGRTGSVERKSFAWGELKPGVNFNFALMRYGSDGQPFETPRHRHTFEQVRFVVDGVHNYGPKSDLPEGWAGYFPAGAYYGPQCDAGGTVLYLQFGPGYVTRDQQAWAWAELEKTGTLKNGVYTTIDASSGRKVNKDSVQALFEFVQKRPLEFPNPRYPAPIAINTRAFEWRRLSTALSHKPLGTFTEGEVTLNMFRWDSTDECKLRPAAQFMFSLTDGVSVDGDRLPARTAVWSPMGETVTIDGEAGASLFAISVL